MDVVYCIATILALVHLGSSVTCPYPFLAIGSGCYYIPPETNIDWIHASAICSLDYKGYLAEITNQQEQANIAALINSTDPKCSYYYYVGATDSLQNRNFRWMKSGNYMAYSNWNAGEPNNDCSTVFCVILYPYSRLCKWDDIKCTTRSDSNIPLKAVCEANPIEPLNTESKSTNPVQPLDTRSQSIHLVEQSNTISKSTCHCTNINIMPNAGIINRSFPITLFLMLGLCMYYVFNY